MWEHNIAFTANVKVLYFTKKTVSTIAAGLKYETKIEINK